MNIQCPREDKKQRKSFNAKDEKVQRTQRRVLWGNATIFVASKECQQPRRLSYLKSCKSVLFCKNGSENVLILMKS